MMFGDKSGIDGAIDVRLLSRSQGLGKGYSLTIRVQGLDAVLVQRDVGAT